MTEFPDKILMLLFKCKAILKSIFQDCHFIFAQNADFGRDCAMRFKIDRDVARFAYFGISAAHE